MRALVPVHREVWLLGTATTTVWADIGDPDFPFAPIPGAFLEQGIGSLFGWTIVDNTLLWHGQNEDGGRVGRAARAGEGAEAGADGDPGPGGPAASAPHARGAPRRRGTGRPGGQPDPARGPRGAGGG